MSEGNSADKAFFGETMSLTEAAEALGSLRSYVTAELKKQDETVGDEVLQLFGETITLSGSLGLLESLRDYLLYSLEQQEGGASDVKLFAPEEQEQVPRVEEDLEVLKQAAERDPKIRKLIGDLAELARNATGS